MSDNIKTLWTYSGGKWTALETDILAPYEKNDERGHHDSRASLSAAGFGYPDRTDACCVLSIREAVEETDLTREWKFLIEFCPCAHFVYQILVRDLADLFALAPAMGALSTLEAAATYQSEVERETEERFSRGGRR